MEEKKEAIANLQAIQFSKGQTKKGGKLPYYSERSVNEFGKTPGSWSLRDTGSLYAGLKVTEINNKGWRIIGTSETTELVLGSLKLKGYKEADVFGLNKETRTGGQLNDALATEIIFPELKKQCEKQAGIKL